MPKLGGCALASIGAALVMAAGQSGEDVSSRQLIGDVLLLGMTFLVVRTWPARPGR